jgi:hypothetical protein
MQYRTRLSTSLLNNMISTIINIGQIINDVAIRESPHMRINEPKRLFSMLTILVNEQTKDQKICVYLYICVFFLDLAIVADTTVVGHL